MHKKWFVIIFVLSIIAGAGALILGIRDKSPTINNHPSNTANVADYYGKNLTTFPKQVLNDTSITTLNLSNNNLTGALPAEIKNLVNLETLNVSNNQMTGIPAEIGQLKNLKVLNYANNKLTGLPMELGNLTQLQVLDLSGNSGLSQQDLAKIKAKLTNTQIKS